MITEQEFNQAQQDVKTLTERPSNDDLLALYANFKQATEGDVQGDRPGGFDFKAMAKYDAWAKLKERINLNMYPPFLDLIPIRCSGDHFWIQKDMKKLKK